MPTAPIRVDTINPIQYSSKLGTLEAGTELTFGKYSSTKGMQWGEVEISQSDHETLQMFLREGDLLQLKFVFRMKHTFMLAGVSNLKVSFYWNDIELFCKAMPKMVVSETKVVNITNLTALEERVPNKVQFWTPDEDVKNYGKVYSKPFFTVVRK